MNPKLPSKYSRVYSKLHKKKGTVLAIIDYSTPAAPIDVKVVLDDHGMEYCHLNDLTPILD